MRIKNNQLATSSNGEEVKVSRLFHDVAIHQHKNIKKENNIGGLEVRLSGTRAHNGELLIVASNYKKIDGLIPIYGMRWEIESLFQALKGRGFNLEDTHLTDANKISKLIALISIAFVWAHKVGEYRNSKIQPIRRKKHGRPQYSYFRYGLDIIINAIQKLRFYAKEFNLCLKILAKTDWELRL